MTRFVFVTGGVVSSLGKGIAAASLGAILEARGLKVAMVEDLIMEFEEGPENVASGLAELRAVQRSIEDALVPMMAGIVRLTGWMRGID